MSDSSVSERVRRFQSYVSRPPSLTVSEMARGTEWREALPNVGLYEVFDRGTRIGYFMSCDYADALDETIRGYESDEEEKSLAAMVDARSGLERKSGAELVNEALRLFDSQESEAKNGR